MKKIIVLFVALILIFTLAGCGGKEYSFNLENNYAEQGFYWEAESEDEKIAKSLSDDKISVLKEGKTTINLSYNAPGGEEPLYYYRADIEVDKDLNVKIIKEDGSYIAVKKIIEHNDELKNYVFRLTEEPIYLDNEECYYFVVSNDNESKTFAVGTKSFNIYIMNEEGDFVSEDSGNE